MTIINSKDNGDGIDMKWSPEFLALRRASIRQEQVNLLCRAQWIRQQELLFYYRRDRNQHYMMAELERAGVLASG